VKPCGAQHEYGAWHGDTLIQLLLECTLPAHHRGDHYDAGAGEWWHYLDGTP
jgi:hypothetical protein